MIKFNKDKFMQLHWKAKTSIRRIANLWNVSPYSIYKWVEEQHIPVRRGKYLFSREKLQQWYWRDEFTFQQIADELGINRNCVANILRKANIPKRTKSERMKLAWRRGDITRETKLGEKNPLWKGGRTISSSGYILIHKPNHIRAGKNGYVYEHILVLEQKLGHSLPKGWVGHHLNGKRDDNRPNNLEAMPNKKHNLLIPIMHKRIQELETLLNARGQLI